MAKWIKLTSNEWINVACIIRLKLIGYSGGAWSVIANNTMSIAKCKDYEEANQFLEKFINDHYVKSGKVE